jgi:hypothetical protein
MNEATAKWLSEVSNEFQFDGTMLSLKLKAEWRERVKAQYHEPYMVDLSAWPNRAEVTLLSDGAPFTKSFSGMNLASVLLGLFRLVSDTCQWPSLPASLLPATEKAKQHESESGSDNGDEDSASGGGGSDSDQSFPSGSDAFDSDASFGEPDEIEEDPMEDTEEYMCSDLQKDVTNYIDMFGEGKITHKYSIGRNATDLTLFFDPADYIGQATADAWGVHLDLPIAICLRISASRYRETGAPKAEIWQPGARTSEDEIAEEIKIEEALKEKGRMKEIELRALHYPNGVPASELAVLADMVAKSVPGYTPGPVAQPKPRPYNAGRFGLQAQLTTITNQFLAKYWPEGSKLSDSIGLTLSTADEAAISKLTDMGYSRVKSVKAWNASKDAKGNGDLTIAGNLLADPSFGNAHKAASASSSIVHAPGTGKPRRKKKIKAEVDWSSGFLVALGSYFVQRFATVNDYCVICDLPHIGVGASLLKPCVCTRDLCCWSFQQLGVGADASSEIATPVDVTDLLVSMVIAAAKSPRNNQILEPFPTIFDPRNPSKPALSPDNKDWTLLNKIVTAICSVDSKLPGAWRHGLQKAHDLAWPLLNWITSSNRSHLVRLPPNYFINSMGTPYQYLLISAPPEKEAAFQRNKKQYGSHWAFHGSKPENWHSILRRGLINASGTALQLNGAAYGHGIYISPAANVSFGYSMLGSNGPKFQLDGVTGLPDPLRPQDTNHCIALCEVVNHDLTKNGDIWVQKNPENVVTRIFFVYPKGVAASGASNNHCSNSNFITEIENAAKFFVQQTGDPEYDSDEEY